LFLNETLHPEAADLFDMIRLCEVRDQADDAKFYNPLVEWQGSRGMRDEKTADLYARIEEAFTAKPLHSLSRLTAISMLSRSLWQNEKEFPHG